MSRYGSCIGTKSVQRSEWEAVRKILDRYPMKEEDEKKVLSVILQANFEWSQANAFGCFMDEYLRDKLGPKKYMDFLKETMADMAGYITTKTLETYYDPEEDLEGWEYEGWAYEEE